MSSGAEDAMKPELLNFGNAQGDRGKGLSTMEPPMFAATVIADKTGQRQSLGHTTSLNTIVDSLREDRAGLDALQLILNAARAQEEELRAKSQKDTQVKVPGEVDLDSPTAKAKEDDAGSDRSRTSRRERTKAKTEERSPSTPDGISLGEVTNRTTGTTEIIGKVLEQQNKVKEIVDKMERSKSSSDSASSAQKIVPEDAKDKDEGKDKRMEAVQPQCEE